MSSVEKTLNIVILGLENAGKTTLARTIAGKEFVEKVHSFNAFADFIGS